MVYNLLFHAPLPTHPRMRVILILNCFADYANCITSASSSFNSSNDKVGTHKPISSSDSFPIFIILPAVSLSAPDGSGPAGGKPAACEASGHRCGHRPPAGGGWLCHSGQLLDVGLSLCPCPDLAALPPLLPRSGLSSVGELALFSVGSRPDDCSGLRERKAAQL